MTPESAAGIGRGTDLAPAVAALRAGRVVAIPTDTVYGLAVDPTRAGATRQLFALKQRPQDTALALLVADLDQGAGLAGPSEMAAAARRLAERFWPGALTIVVTRRRGLDWHLGGDPSTVGLRCPASLLTRTLCGSVGPMAVTSANRHGEAPSVTADEVRAAFGPQLVVVDGGRCDAAVSTVVDASGAAGQPPRCLRQGAVAWDEVVSALDT